MLRYPPKDLIENKMNKYDEGNNLWKDLCGSSIKWRNRTFRLYQPIVIITLYLRNWLLNFSVHISIFFSSINSSICIFGFITTFTQLLLLFSSCFSFFLYLLSLILFNLKYINNCIPTKILRIINSKTKFLNLILNLSVTESQFLSEKNILFRLVLSIRPIIFLGFLYGSWFTWRVRVTSRDFIWMLPYKYSGNRGCVHFINQGFLNFSFHFLYL